MTSKFIKIVLILGVLLLIMVAFFPKIWSGAANILSIVGIGEGICKETGMSITEYNNRLDEELYQEKEEESFATLLEFLTCFDETKSLVIKEPEDAQFLAEQLCDYGYFEYSGELYDYIPDEVELKDSESINKKEYCLQFYAISQIFDSQQAAEEAHSLYLELSRAGELTLAHKQFFGNLIYKNPQFHYIAFELLREVRTSSQQSTDLNFELLNLNSKIENLQKLQEIIAYDLATEFIKLSNQEISKFCFKLQTHQPTGTIGGIADGISFAEVKEMCNKEPLNTEVSLTTATNNKIIGQGVLQNSEYISCNTQYNKIQCFGNGNRDQAGRPNGISFSGCPYLYNMIS